MNWIEILLILMWYFYQFGFMETTVKIAMMSSTKCNLVEDALLYAVRGVHC